jgi:hypothetical protein
VNIVSHEQHRFLYKRRKAPRIEQFRRRTSLHSGQFEPLFDHQSDVDADDDAAADASRDASLDNVECFAVCFVCVFVQASCIVCLSNLIITQPIQDTLWGMSGSGHGVGVMRLVLHRYTFARHMIASLLRGRPLLVIASSTHQVNNGLHARSRCSQFSFSLLFSIFYMYQ